MDGCLFNFLLISPTYIGLHITIKTTPLEQGIKIGLCLELLRWLNKGRHPWHANIPLFHRKNDSKGNLDTFYLLLSSLSQHLMTFLANFWQILPKSQKSACFAKLIELFDNDCFWAAELAFYLSLDQGLSIKPMTLVT